MSPPRLAFALAAWLALAPAARAIDVQSDVAVQSNKSMADYFADLSGNEDGDRLFAARVLLGELKRSLRIAERAKPGSLAALDAQALLLELEARLPRGCATAIRFKNTAAACAEVFGLLEDPSALPILREVLAGETRAGARKRIEAAIAVLAPLAPPVPADPPAAPTPPAPSPAAPPPAPNDR